MIENLKEFLDLMISCNYSINNNGKWDSNMSNTKDIDNDQLINKYLNDTFSSKKIN